MRSTEELPAPIENEIVRGLLLWLGETFNLREGSNLFYSANNLKALRAAAIKQAQEGKALSYPIMYVRISGFNRSVNRTAYNPRSLARHGVYAVLDSSQRAYARKLHPMRVDLEFEIVYMTKDDQDALRFGALWMSLGQESKLNFTLNYYGTGVDIGVVLSESISVPEKDASVDEPVNVFEFSTNLNVEGYVTALHVDNDSKIPLVQKISVAHTPVVSEDLRDPAGSRILNQVLNQRRT